MYIKSGVRIGGIKISGTFPTANLAVWLRADAGVTLSGASVNLWEDQSGNGNNVSPEFDSPTYESSVINSRPALSFSQASLTGDMGFNFANDNTLFIVFKARDVNAGALWGQGYGEFVSAITDGYTQISSSNIVGIVSSDTESFANTPYLFASTNSSFNYKIFLNGVQTGQAFYNQFYQISSTQYIGSDFNNDGQYSYFYDGYISEIIIYHRALTTTERKIVETYLNNKYQIY